MSEAETLHRELLDTLAAMIAAVGPRSYVAAPQIHYDERCFPDPWEPSMSGVRSAVRRFMVHLGMRDVPLDLVDARADAAENQGPATDPVQFEGFDDGIAQVVVYAINEARHMAAWLALEVTAMWVFHTEFDRPDHLPYRGADVELDNDDLDPATLSILAVVLGLGPVLAAGSIQHHKSERLDGPYAVGQWSMAIVGGLPPPAVAYLLAAHATALGDRSDVAQIREGLHADLRRDFDRAVAELGPDAATLRDRLGLSAADAWPPVRPLDLDPIPSDEATIAEDSEADAAFENRRRFPNTGLPTFRVRRTGASNGRWILGGIGGIVMLIVEPSSFPLFLAGVVGGGVLGHLIGSRSVGYRCSGPDCDLELTVDMTTCPRCGGSISGEIKHAKERLAAEEALEARGVATGQASHGK